MVDLRELMRAARVLPLAASLLIPAQSASFIPVPSNITVRGLPPIPRTVADDLARYASYTSSTMLAWSPTGRSMLVLTTATNALAIHAVESPQAEPKQLTFFDSGVTPFAAYDPNDGGTFVFRRDVGAGAELNQLFRFDVATSTPTMLTDRKSRNGEPAWARDGKWIAYASTPPNGRDSDICVMRPSDVASQRVVAHEQGTWAVSDWSPDGRTLLALESVSETETRLWRIAVDSGEKTALTSEAGLWSAPQLTAEGRYVYALSDAKSEVVRLWRKDLRSNRWESVTSKSEAVESFALSFDGRFAAIVFDHDASSELDIVELPAMKPRRHVTLPPGTISRLTWRPGSQEVGFTFSSSGMLGDVYSYDRPTGKLARWTRSQVSFDTEALPPPEIIRWKSFDNVTISGILYRPPQRFAGPRPVMINIHGGPLSRERPRFQGRSNYLLNELGIAIIFPNVRGSDGFGKSFGHLDDGIKRQDAVKDIGALLDWIARQPNLDKRRVMVTGASYGGYLTLASAIEYGDRLRCAFAAAAISNFVTFLESTEPSRQSDRRSEYGNEQDPIMRPFLADISPVKHAARLRIPLMIAHGASDVRVPLSQAEEIVSVTAANGTPVWYVVYADVGHDNFPGGRANADFNFYCWILFVRTFLVG